MRSTDTTSSNRNSNPFQAHVANLQATTSDDELHSSNQTLEGQSQKKPNNSFDTSQSVRKISSEMTDMEANERRREKSLKKRKRSSSRGSSKSRDQISFVLERKNEGGSIFGDSNNSNQTHGGQKSLGRFGLGIMMIVCCVSSQIMIEEAG